MFLLLMMIQTRLSSLEARSPSSSPTTAGATCRPRASRIATLISSLTSCDDDVATLTLIEDVDPRIHDGIARRLQVGTVARIAGRVVLKHSNAGLRQGRGAEHHRKLCDKNIINVSEWAKYKHNLNTQKGRIIFKLLSEDDDRSPLSHVFRPNTVSNVISCVTAKHTKVDTNKVK